MTLTLKIPQELERELSTEASRLGLPLSEYALRVLSARQAPVAMPRLARSWWPTGTTKG